MFLLRVCRFAIHTHVWSGLRVEGLRYNPHAHSFVLGTAEINNKNKVTVNRCLKVKYPGVNSG